MSDKATAFTEKKLEKIFIITRKKTPFFKRKVNCISCMKTHREKKMTEKALSDLQNFSIKNRFFRTSTKMNCKPT